MTTMQYGPPPDVRTVAAMRTGLALLEALHTNDVQAAESIINGCDDPAPVLFVLAGLVLSAAEREGRPVPLLLAGLRAQIPDSGA